MGPMSKYFSVAAVALALTTPSYAGFTSASGLPPGSSQSNPVYPTFWSASAPGQYFGGFASPTSNQWYSSNVQPGGLWQFGYNTVNVFMFDPTAVFQSVTAPEGFGSMTLRTQNSILDPDFQSGEVYTFSAATSRFWLVLNETSAFPPGSMSANSFQLKVAINGSPQAMYWLTEATAPVPETSTFALTLLGLLGLGLLAGGVRGKAR